MPDREQALKASRELIVDAEFKARHRITKKALTGSRRLTFPLVITLLVRKGLKLLQNNRIGLEAVRGRAGPCGARRRPTRSIWRSRIWPARARAISW